MASDPSWDIMPVASPALPERKRLIRGSLARDPVGLAEPLYQLRHRDQVVVPSTLDGVSRELLNRAQTAISSALDSVTDDAVESPDILTEPTLRRHEWQIAIALRDITDLRAEHEFGCGFLPGDRERCIHPGTAAADRQRGGARDLVRGKCAAR